MLEKHETEKRYKIAEYKLENGLLEEENKEQLIYAIADVFSYADTIIILALLIVCGSIVSDEFNKGTIKQLLVKPFTRSQILLSKIIASAIAILLFSLLYYSVDIICLSIAYGNYTALFSNALNYNFNTQQVVEMNLALYCLLKFIIIMPMYIIIFAFVLFIGVLTTSTIGAISSGFGLFFFSELINAFLPDKILSFLPTFCWNMSSYLSLGMSSNPYGSLVKSVIVCVITLILLIVSTFIIFKNKDIKNQ